MSNYYVICDSTNNTPESITRGELIVNFGITVYGFKCLDEYLERFKAKPEDHRTKIARKASERKQEQQNRLKNIFGPKFSKYK